MDIDALLLSLRETPWAVGIRDSLYWFPVLESIHVIGLALVFGTIIVIDLRLLGKASTSRPFGNLARDIVKWTWVAFALTFLTGFLMFSTNAVVYYHNAFFRVKMGLLLLSAINMGAFELTLGRRSHEWGKNPSAPKAGRVVGALSLIIWLGVIFTGRMIGFTATRVTPTEPPPAEINFDDLFETSPATETPPAVEPPPDTK